MWAMVMSTLRCCILFLPLPGLVGLLFLPNASTDESSAKSVEVLAGRPLPGPQQCPLSDALSMCLGLGPSLWLANAAPPVRLTPQPRPRQAFARPLRS